MRQFFTSTILALWPLTSHALAADKAAEPKLDEVHPQTQIVRLFNGHNLDGWKTVGGNGQFKAENGSIVGSGTNVKGNTFLRTKKTYQNFILSFEFKFDDRSGNSGLMFRARQKPSKNGNGRVFGYQCEADHADRSWTAGLYDEARRGWLFPTKNKQDAEHRQQFTSQGIRLFKWNDWNRITIRCQKNHIQTWLNGELRTDWTDTDSRHDTRKGFFALQVHSGKSCHVRWKNMMLKELPTTQP